MTERHCGTCLCVEMAAPELTDEAIEAAYAAEKAGTEPGHEHCPDCGCNPEGHTEHADGCRRIGTTVELQCGPPWNPWPDAKQAAP